MKREIVSIPIAILLIVIGCMGSRVWTNAFAQDGSHANFAVLAPRWEYKVVRFPAPGAGELLDTNGLEDTINRLGEDGWECTGTISEVGGGVNQFNKTNAVLIFKRLRN